MTLRWQSAFTWFIAFTLIQQCDPFTVWKLTSYWEHWLFLRVTKGGKALSWKLKTKCQCRRIQSHCSPEEAPTREEPPKESRKITVRLSTSRQPSRARQRRANPTEIKALCCQKAEDVPETWKHHRLKQPGERHLQLELRRAPEKPGASQLGTLIPPFPPACSCSCLQE